MSKIRSDVSLILTLLDIRVGEFVLSLISQRSPRTATYFYITDDWHIIVSYDPSDNITFHHLDNWQKEEQIIRSETYMRAKRFSSSSHWNIINFVFTIVFESDDWKIMYLRWEQRKMKRQSITILSSWHSLRKKSVKNITSSRRLVLQLIALRLYEELSSRQHMSGRSEQTAYVRTKEEIQFYISNESTTKR